MNDFISMMGFRETAINNIINDLAKEPSRDINSVQEEICRKNGIPIRDLTASEILEIEERVRFKI